uniref:Uncharacterized protein n=1 Tax=Knipowitschia caucasica TaxID=637954 RepID=A0AAV2LDH5_KNICA
MRNAAVPTTSASPPLPHRPCLTDPASPTLPHHLCLTDPPSPTLPHRPSLTDPASPPLPHHLCLTTSASPSLPHHLCLTISASPTPPHRNKPSAAGYTLLNILALAKTISLPHTFDPSSLPLVVESCCAGWQHSREKPAGGPYLSDPPPSPPAVTGAWLLCLARCYLPHRSRNMCVLGVELSLQRTEGHGTYG